MTHSETEKTAPDEPTNGEENGHGSPETTEQPDESKSTVGDDGDTAADISNGRKSSEKLSSKKQIKDALNKGGKDGKAASLRKKRMRNDLRAEAYHAARGSTGVPLRLKILCALVLVAAGMLVYHRGKYTKSKRVDNIWESAKAGDYEKVKRVLDARPEFVDLTDGKGNTLMHYAAMSGNVDICRAIIELRGRYSRLNAVRRLPIHYAAEYGSVGVAEILLNLNTVVNLPDSDGLQPIHLAARNGHADIIDLFREKAPKSLNVNAVASFKMTALHFAAQAGKTNAVKALLKFKGVKTNLLNSHGQTPLHFAVRGGYKEMIKILIAAGADPNFASKGTRSALDFAKESKDPEILKILTTAPSPTPKIENGK